MNTRKVKRNFIKTAIRSFRAENISPEEKVADTQSRAVVAGILCISALLLSCMNFAKGYWLMMATTLALAAAFAVSYFLAKKYQKDMVASLIMGLACAAAFSYYAISGQNSGFAILWIVLIPTVSMMALGAKVGLVLSLYFQLFTIALFYTPLKNLVAMHYTETFMDRFPILYLTGLAASVFLTLQRQYYLQVTKDMSYEDNLTGLENRSSFEKVKKEISAGGTLKDYVLVMADLNRLKYVNDTYGHDAGDELICGAADALRGSFDQEDDYLFRIGGDEFVVLSKTDPRSIVTKLSELRERCDVWHGELSPELSISAGMVIAEHHPQMDIDQIQKLADQKMYEAKRRFYSQSGYDRRK